jgi:transcription regulator MmyB-like protein
VVAFLVQIGRGYRSDLGLQRLLARLTQSSAEFRHLWLAHDVQTSPTCTKWIRHPQVG